MGPGLASFPPYYLVLGALCGVVGFRIGWRVPHPWVLPIVQGIAGYFAFVLAWRAEGPLFAALTEIGWAVGTSAMAIWTFKRAEDGVDERVLRAGPYRAEMLEWLRSGSGPESRPFHTSGRHLRELAGYLVAAVATANFLSLVMGAILLNYMNAYVTVLLCRARRPWPVRLLAWNSWSLVRVAAYVMLGTAAAAPLARSLGLPGDADEVRGLVIFGFAGVSLDLALKLALSRTCGRRLAASVDLEARR